MWVFFFFQAEDGIRDHCVTGVQTCTLPIYSVNMPTNSVTPPTSNVTTPTISDSSSNPLQEITTPTVRVWPAADTTSPGRVPCKLLAKQDSNDNVELGDDAMALRHIEELRRRGFISWPHHSLDTDSYADDSCDTLSDISQHSHNDTFSLNRQSFSDEQPASGAEAITKQSPPLSRTSTDSDLSLSLSRQTSSASGVLYERVGSGASLIRPSADSLSSLDGYFSHIHITDYDDSIETFTPALSAASANPNHASVSVHQQRQEQQQPFVSSLVIPHHHPSLYLHQNVSGGHFHLR